MVKDFRCLKHLRIDHRMKKLVEMVGRYAKDGRVLVDKTFGYHVNCALDRGCTGALAVAGLEKEKFALLDGEFHVLHIVEMLLKAILDSDQLFVNGFVFF